jgi:hypothetical protein
MKKKHPNKKVELLLNHPSLNKYGNAITKKYNKLALLNYNASLKLLKEKFKNDKNIETNTFNIRNLNEDSFCYFSKYKRARNDFKERINKAINFLKEKNIKLNKTCFITSETSYKYAIREFPNLFWIKIKNKTYGGDFVCASLLTLNDIKEGIKSINKSIKYYILSKDMFYERNGKRDIANKDVKSFEDETNSKVFTF